MCPQAMHLIKQRWEGQMHVAMAIVHHNQTAVDCQVLEALSKPSLVTASMLVSIKLG